MPTEMELTLEQTQQGVSYEVSSTPYGFEDGSEDFCYSDTERLSRSDEVLKLKNFKKDATLKLSKSTNQEWYEHVVHDKEFNERTIHTFQGSRTKYSEEEVAGIMTETMEQYMTKTQADYGSGVARPKIEDEDNFELKGQFLKELRASVSVMPLSTYLNLGLDELVHTKLTVELADMTVKYPKGIAKNVLVGIGKFVFPVDFIILDMPEDIKVPLILERPFLSTARANIDVYKRKITLRVGEERIVFTSVKPASSLIKRVYMLSLRERMELNLEARLMGETLVLNRSLDPFFEDYIELNDLNEPYELRRNQGDDLMPTIEEGGVIEEFRTRDDELNTGINDYCDYGKKIHIDCAHNLKFSGMIGFEFTHANFFSLLYVNVMSKRFCNSIMKDRMVYKGNNVIGALMNVLIFVGTFSVVADFTVLENMDAYRDERMGDVLFGEPFLRDVGI
ncbi:putative reverse transcriptase domain-containing protein [Tanacetum coccineum]